MYKFFPDVYSGRFEDDMVHQEACAKIRYETEAIISVIELYWNNKF